MFLKNILNLYPVNRLHSFISSNFLSIGYFGFSMYPIMLPENINYIYYIYYILLIVLARTPSIMLHVFGGKLINLTLFPIPVKKLSKYYY